MLTEYILRHMIFIDFSWNFHFTTDQVFVSYPCKVAGVTFHLLSSEMLENLADYVRMENGHKPFQLRPGYSECDNDGWYEFTIGINTYTKSKVDNFILCETLNTEDNSDENFGMDISEEEQKIIYDILDEQLKKYCDQGCEELLKQAEAEMRLDGE